MLGACRARSCAGWNGRLAQPREARCAARATRRAGPGDDPPDYSDIDSSPFNQTIMALFRRKMVDRIGEDTEEQGYAGIIALTRKLNSMYKDPKDTQEATQEILLTLFPKFIPPFFAVMFAKPFPAWSNWLNAWVTMLTCQWLMGPSKVNDVEMDDGTIAKDSGVLVERCRYLEEAGCASICINSCKVPTQEFFRRNMGMDVSLEPNYDDFSCQFAFGKKPLPQEQDEVFTTPCFMNCPSKKFARGGETCAGAAVEEAEVQVEEPVKQPAST